MTLDQLFLVIVPIYLVLIAYGQVGSRRRGLSGPTRFVAGALRIVLPALAILGALAIEGDTLLFRAWAGVVLAMAIAGVIVAALVEVVAPRIGA